MEASNWIAIASTVIALWALWVSIKTYRVGKRQAAAADEANKIAKEAKEKAGEANDIAREANKISEQNNARAGERNVVALEWGWQTDGRVRVTNTGEGTARKLEGKFSINRETHRIDEPQLSPNESFYISFPEAYDALQHRRIKDQNREAAKERKLAAGSTNFYIGNSGPKYNDVARYRLTWETPMGNIGKWESDKAEFFNLEYGID